VAQETLPKELEESKVKTLYVKDKMKKLKTLATWFILAIIGTIIGWMMPIVIEALFYK